LSNKSILFITVTFPPRLSVASLRLYNYAQLFKKNNWNVYVITCNQKNQTESKEFKLDNLKITYVEWDDPYNKISKIKPKILRKICFKALNIFIPYLSTWLPDNRFNSWKQNSEPIINDLIKKESIKYIYSSFSPPTPHLLAKKIKAQNPSVKWIAEYRDMWSFSPTLSILKKQFKHLHFKLEKKVVNNADLLITVSFGHKEILKKHLSKKIIVLYNGCDFDSYHKLDANVTGFKIVYTGNYYRKNNDLKCFFEAFKFFTDQNKSLKKQIRLTFVGTPKSAYLSRLIKKYSIDEFVEFKAKVENVEVKKIQRSSSVLLHFAWKDKNHMGNLTGKIFEYISARKPILSIGHEPELNQIILKHGGLMSENISQIVSFLNQQLNNPSCLSKITNENSEISKLNQFKNLESEILNM